eukprot:2151830-Pleurochrysis_carterae.AAC.2
MGGPSIKYRYGRVDAAGPEECPPDGRLPDAHKGAPHLRDIFYRMGFNDQEIVALSGELPCRTHLQSVTLHAQKYAARAFASSVETLVLMRNECPT